MQVSIETTTGLERRMTVGIPAEQVESEVTKRLQEAARTVRLNGFRKGKVPLKVVKQRFGAGVRQEVIGEVMSRSFYDAIQQEDVRPAGQPAIEPKEMTEGKDVEFVATFEVYPEIALGDIAGFEIEKLTAEVQDADIDKMIDTLRQQQASWSDVERPAAIGDQVNIDFTGTKDGEEFEGGKAEGQKLELGTGSMIPGFEDGIVGMQAGEEKVLSLTFPDDYHSEDLKGAAVEFQVKVNSVAEKTLPELDEEFYSKYGIEGKDEAEFRAEVRKNMERELKNAAKTKVKNQVMDKLIEAHQVDLPKALISGEIETLRNQMMQQFGGAQPNMDLKSLLPDDMFKEQAERRVALGLIVAEIVKAADIKVDSDRVRAMIDEMASTYQEPEEVVNYYYSNQQLLASVESAVLEDQVVDHVLDGAKVTETASTYEEVVKQAGGEQE
ncbi:MAG: trigger factor [Gammaproteobacteria bacterium]|uniref:trigger factor n=1 Tax=Pseudomaricurvus alcaniphilus TaxID=1166482 RepID=UPI00140C0CFE|nr:trigger factor [Pseudomaricurvus alcaniphilus]MBR9911923.1 trigger factor [Gammaproteobacteria bacterium]NHN36026.1 trigger factor [Pseudomaricurvus alcaniphilus]